MSRSGEPVREIVHALLVLPDQFAGLPQDAIGQPAARFAEPVPQIFVEPLLEQVRNDKPLLGICVGMQLMFEYGEEGAGSPGLGILPGRVVRFPESGLKVPHMGWNQIARRLDAPHLRGIADDARVYFVHSYYVETPDPSIVASWTGYGQRFASAVCRDHIWATQFHPEKSQKLGLALIANFLRWTP